MPCACQNKKISGMAKKKKRKSSSRKVNGLSTKAEPITNTMDAVKGAVLVSAGYAGANFIGGQVGKLAPQLQSTIAQAIIKTVAGGATIYASVKNKTYKTEGTIAGVGMTMAGVVDLASMYLPGTVTQYLPINNNQASIEGIRALRLPRNTIIPQRGQTNSTANGQVKLFA